MASLTPTPLTDEEFESLPWALSCQKDSYELTKSATVIKCYELQVWASLYDSSAGVNGEEGGLGSQNDGKKKKKKKKKKKNGNDSGDAAKEQPIEPKFGILFDDTVFFPEGGGQPFDTGVIEYNDSAVKVVNCQRFGPGGKLVLHYTAEPIPENASVILKVDETRRTDHMLHHSSQHLITAVALNSYNRKTLSWNLAPRDKTCFVELSGELKMEDEEVQALEDDVNACIRKNLSMLPSFYTHEEYEARDSIRKAAKGLKLGGSPLIRVVEIDGIDENACCGTHVKQLKDLQAIKFVSTEKSKNGNTKLHYLTGKRLLQRFHMLEESAKKLTSTLTCGVDQHADVVKGLLQSQKDAHRSMKSLLKSFAAMSANVFNHPEFTNESNIIYQHLPTGNSDFMKHFIREVKSSAINQERIKTVEKLMIFVSVGNESTAGAFMIEGPEEAAAALGAKLTTLWSAKGGGKRGKFQAKVPPGILNEANVLKGQELAAQLSAMKSS